MGIAFLIGLFITIGVLLLLGIIAAIMAGSVIFALAGVLISLLWVGTLIYYLFFRREPPPPPSTDYRIDQGKDA